MVSLSQFGCSGFIAGSVSMSMSNDNIVDFIN